MATAYTWAPGSRVVGLKAQAVGEELDRIRSKHGDLTPDAVVKESRRKTAPLHKVIYAETEQEAAKRWRIEKAKYLLRSVAIERVEDDERQPVRAFVSVLRNQEQVYEPTHDALADPFLRKQVLDRALADAKSFRQKYDHLEEMATVVEAIDVTLEQAA